jgi:5'(3')-deoxyribonucleotidase
MSNGIIIEDNAKNLENSNANIKICYGDIYDWNKNWNGIRCWNWTEVYDFLME